MDEVQLKHLCNDLCDSPSLAFRPEGAWRASLSGSGLPSKGGEAQLGLSGIFCRLGEEGRGIVLHARSHDRFLAGHSVWVSLCGKDERMTAGKLLLHEARRGGCEGSLCVGPRAEIQRKLGDQASLTVFPPRIDLNLLVGRLLKALREAPASQRKEVLAHLVSHVEAPLRRELEKQIDHDDRSCIKQVILDTMSKVVRLRRASFGPEPFVRLVSIASELLREAHEHAPVHPAAAATTPSPATAACSEPRSDEGDSSQTRAREERPSDGDSSSLATECRDAVPGSSAGAGVPVV